MRARSHGIASLIVGALGCSGSGATPDAAITTDMVVAADAAAPVAPTCTCCTKLPFTATQALDVVSDGATLYVLFESATSSQRQLGIVSDTGGEPTVVATAEKIVIASFEDTVFYAAATGSSYELHQRTGTVDGVVGSVTSDVPVQLGGNASDLYVFGSEAGTATLWRFSRASNGAPAIVATVNGAASWFALGSTVATLMTSSGSWLVSVPGPSTPSVIAQGTGRIVFSGDEGFALSGQLLTSHASRWFINRITPTQATIWMSSVIINGGYDELRADPSHLYFRVTSGSEDPSSTTSRSLSRIAPDGTNLASVCGSWPSDVLRLDPTRLLGLEKTTDGQWFVDVLAKP